MIFFFLDAYFFFFYTVFVFVKFFFLGRVVLKISIMIRSRAIAMIPTMMGDEGVGVQSSGACLIGRMSVISSHRGGFINWRRTASSRLYLIACEKELHVSQKYSNRSRKVKQNMITVFF